MINHVAAGCAYKSSGSSGYQSMYGRVTDVQIFGKTLSENEMIAVTNCDISLHGDILRWDNTTWIRSGTKKNIKEESLDWKATVCNNSNKSFHIIPQKLNFSPESLIACEKLSAKLAGHESLEDFHGLVRYVSSSNIVKGETCLGRILERENYVVINS